MINKVDEAEQTELQERISSLEVREQQLEDISILKHGWFIQNHNSYSKGC